MNSATNTAAINAKEGVEHSVTPPHTPNKNSAAERFNRTYIEGVAAMLIHSGMSDKHWVEASKYFVYLKNRTVHRSKKWRTPYELFWKRKPHKVEYGTFGCYGFGHVNIENRSKKELNKAVPITFMGIEQWQIHLRNF